MVSIQYNLGYIGSVRNFEAHNQCSQLIMLRRRQIHFKNLTLLQLYKRGNFLYIFYNGLGESATNLFVSVSIMLDEYKRLFVSIFTHRFFTICLLSYPQNFNYNNLITHKEMRPCPPSIRQISRKKSSSAIKTEKPSNLSPMSYILLREHFTAGGRSTVPSKE